MMSRVNEEEPGISVSWIDCVLVRCCLLVRDYEASSGEVASLEFGKDLGDDKKKT